jgi:hypothetical protein
MDLTVLALVTAGVAQIVLETVEVELNLAMAATVEMVQFIFWQSN